MISNILESIIILYLVSTLQYCGTIFPKDYVQYIRDNKVLQHFILFFMLCNIIKNKSSINSIPLLIGLAIVIYILFLLTIKLNPDWMIAYFGMLFIFFIYETHIQYKNNIYKKNKEIKDTKTTRDENKYRLYMIMFTLFILSFGIGKYGNKQYIQHGGNFNVVDFIIK